MKTTKTIKCMISLAIFCSTIVQAEMLKASSASQADLSNMDSISLIALQQDLAELDDFKNGLVNPLGQTGKSIDQQLSDHSVEGASIVVIEDGKIKHVLHYGYRDIYSLKPTNANTYYHAASTSKFFTGLTFAQADENGDIKLTKNITKIANDYPSSLLALWKTIKFTGNKSTYPDTMNLKRLLGHAGGLDTHGIGTGSDPNSKTFTEILLGSCLTYPLFCDGVEPVYQPATMYDYSGGGFVAAELALELETGSTFSEYATSEILEPLGLDRSKYDNASTSFGNLARKCSGSIPVPWLNTGCPVYVTNVKSAGGLLAHPEDYAKVLTLFANDGLDEDGNQLLSMNVIHKVLTPNHHINSSKSFCNSDSDCSNGESCFQNACYSYPVDADGDGISTKRYGLGVSLSTSLHTDGYPVRMSHGGHDPNMGAAQEMRLNRKTKTGIVIFTNGNTSFQKIGNDGVVRTYGGLVFANEVLNSYLAVWE